MLAISISGVISNRARETTTHSLFRARAADIEDIPHSVSFTNLDRLVQRERKCNLRSAHKENRLNERTQTMARLVKRLREAVASHMPTYYDNKLYEHGKHYMRGPGPACKARAKSSSSQQQKNGSDSRLVVAPGNDVTRVSPDTLGALLSPRR